MLDRDADVDEDLGERIPYPLSKEDETDLQQWLAELQAEVDDVDAALNTALNSLQVGEATGTALDELGKDFGVLGERRGRDDSQYRAFLQTLVAAYGGRGTRTGLRLAIAVGVLADQADVSLIEDFDTQEYEIVFDNAAWGAHTHQALRELADIADPSTVNLRDPVHYRLRDAAVRFLVSETRIAEMTATETATFRPNPGGTVSTTLSTAGLSSSSLAPLSTGGTWDLL